jgi:hypothetical protein
MEQKVGKGKYRSPMVEVEFHGEEVVRTSGGFGIFDEATGDVRGEDIFSQGGGTK